MITGNATISINPTKTALVVGATSSLAQAVVAVLAQRGYALVLAGRDEAECTMLASDNEIRYGATCRPLKIDLLAADFSPEALIAQAGDFDTMLIAAGDMGSGTHDADDIAYTAIINYVLPAQIATAAASYLSRKGNGSIAIISSVAGDRGRQSNYAYGSAKAALTAFTSGLRNCYAKQNLHVMTIKPGFVDTPMTWGMHSPLIASREYVAKKIVHALEKKRDVIYVPFFWRFIMLLIIHIPERVFKRLSL